MRVLSYMVTKDETDRYLKESIEELLPYVDGLLVLDDMSADFDRLREIFLSIAEKEPLKVTLAQRYADDSSFLENEARFREIAWREMSKLYEPEDGDWVLTLDADEFLRSPYPEYIKEYCERLNSEGFDAIMTHVHEVWTDITGPPQIRTDGFWGGISAIRFCKWKPNGKFRDAKMGGGSIPDFTTKIKGTSEFDILHYGYAREADRIAKHQRYTEKKGHNPRHISSILQPPTLASLPPLMVKY